MPFAPTINSVQQQIHRQLQFHRFSLACESDLSDRQLAILHQGPPQTAKQRLLLAIGQGRQATLTVRGHPQVDRRHTPGPTDAIPRQFKVSAVEGFNDRTHGGFEGLLFADRGFLGDKALAVAVEFIAVDGGRHIRGAEGLGTTDRGGLGQDLGGCFGGGLDLGDRPRRCGGGGRLRQGLAGYEPP
jgi:hypothetical protein